MAEVTLAQVAELREREKNGELDRAFMQWIIDNLAAVRNLMLGAAIRVVVNFGLGLRGMIAAGKYSYVDPDIIERVKLTGKGEVEEDLFLVHLNRDVTTEEAEAEIRARGLEPAEIEYGFALTTAEPELKDMTIVCLGSVVVRRDGLRCSPYFGLWDGKRKVFLRRRDSGWLGLCRFLARRKRS